MVVAIDPIVVSFGPLAVRWFGVLAVLGLVVAAWLYLRELAHQGLPRAAALDALAWGLPAGLLFARLTAVLGAWDYYLTRPAEVWQFGVDGLSVWGGLLAGGAIAFSRLGRDRLARRRVLDVAAPYLALGIAVAQVGAFLDGRGQGLPSDLPWATQYTNPLAATPDFGVPRHPVQVYDALLCLGVWGILRSLPSRLPAGTRLASFLVLYGAARLGLAAVRLEPSFLFRLQIEQILALGAVAFGIWYGLSPVARRAAMARAAGPAGPAGPAEDSVAA